jgi:vitamin B12 transporter
MYRLLWLLLTSLLIISSVWAEDEVIKIKEVVVSATKIEEAIEETTSDVIVIKEQDIKEMNVEFVPEVLKNVSELNLIQNGGTGKQATVILRGGDSTHVLVMIDGVRVKSTTTGLFNFSGINIDEIERIEIIKGPQSTLYGSEAIAGVINIITRKGKGKPKIDVSFESGSYGTYKSSVSISGGDKKLDYRLTTVYFYTDGISVAKQGTERDEYKNASVSGKFGFKPIEKFELEVSSKYYYDRSELDYRDVDYLSYIHHGRHYMLSGKGKFYLSDSWEQILRVSKAADSLKDRDPDTPSLNSDVFTSIDAIDWQHNFYISDAYTFTLGAEYRNEKGENKGKFDKAIDNKALYLNNKLRLLNDDLVINAGLRYDDHETFGSETTYRIGTVYDFRPADLRIKSSYGTGFRAPTLNELFYEGVMGSGNPNLKPEKSNSWEIGVEKDIVKDRAMVSLIYFDQDYKELIDWIETPPGSWTWTPQNITRSEVKGIEIGASIKITENTLLKTSYTYLDTENKETGKRLPGRPEDKLNMTVKYSKGDTTILARYTFVGEAYDDVNNSEKLASYSLVNLSSSYKLTRNIKLFGRIDNLLDEDYEVAKDYNTAGFSAFAGVKLEM